jgi:hypothetical protein
MTAVLFLAPTDLGETVLATGALDFALAQTGATETTIVCDPWALNLFIAAPGLTRLYERKPGFGGWADLAWRIAATPFDVAIDFSSAFYPVRAKRHVRVRRHGALQHLAELYSSAVGADRTLATKLWLHDQARVAAAEATADMRGPLLVLAPGGRDGLEALVAGTFCCSRAKAGERTARGRACFGDGRGGARRGDYQRHRCEPGCR